MSGFYRENVLPLRESNMEMSRNAYRGGTVAFLAVLESQRTLLTARALYIEAARDAALGLADIERATGRPIRTILEIDAASQSVEVQP